MIVKTQLISLSGIFTNDTVTF